MERDYNRFTKSIGKIMLIYSIVMSVVVGGMTTNYVQVLEANAANRDVEPVVCCEASETQSPIAYRIMPDITPMTIDNVSDDSEEEVDVVEEVYYEEETHYEEEVYYEEETHYEDSYVEYKQQSETNYASSFTDDEIYLMAKVCLAEAEGETEYGKRLVISTILNRLDAECYPDSVYGVVYQPYQFEVMNNGRIDRVTVTDDIIQLVKEEIATRSNYDVIYFRTDYYSDYGTPLFVEDSHYFSGF